MLGRILQRVSSDASLVKQNGQSIVEMTLITPLLLVALYIPADFGIGLLTAHLTQNAVREAARIGVSTKDPFNSTAASSVGDDAIANLPSRLISPAVTVRYYGAGAANCLQNVEVSAQGTYNFFLYQMMRMVGFSAPDSAVINRATRMRYEFQPVTNSALCTTVSLTETATRP
jgi:Flp pilus assembly protein TadG